MWLSKEIGRIVELSSDLHGEILPSFIVADWSNRHLLFLVVNVVVGVLITIMIHSIKIL